MLSTFALGGAAATRDEAVEFLNVTMAMGGCVGEAGVHKALVAFENFYRKRRMANLPTSGESCCSV